MSKNLTRKGLALGTAAALTVAGLTATPAFAADAVKLSSKYGTSYSVPLYSGFIFNLTGTDLTAADAAGNLALAITAPTGTSVNYAADGTDGSGQVDGDGTAQVINGDLIESNLLEISLDDPQAAADVKITLFIDDENEGVLDADEAQFSRTVKFVKPTLALTLDAPFIGDTTVSGTVSLGAVNTLQVAETSTYVYAPDGLTYLDSEIADFSLSRNGDFDYEAGDGYVLWNATDKEFHFDLVDYASSPVQASDKWVLQGYTGLADADGVLDYVKSGTAVKATVVADKVATLDAIEITESANAVDNGDGTATVRSSATSVVLTAQAWEVDQDTKSPAGQPVRVNVTATTFDADSKFTVAGKTFDDALDDITYFGTTNASGEVVISLSGTFANSDSLYFDVDAQDANADYTVTFEDTEATSLVATSVNDDGVITVKNDASFAISYAAVDQFGQTLTGKYRLALTPTGNGQEDFTAALSGGKATVSFTDSSTADESYTVSAELEIYDADAKTWGGAGLPATVVNVESLEALLTAAEVDGLADTDALDLESGDFATADLRLNPAADPNLGLGQAITGTIVDADGFAVSGAKVTVSAKGLQFADSNGDIYAVDSITVLADAFGDFTVDVWSHTAGDVDITVTSGAAKETVTYTWDAPTAADDADNIFTVTAAKTSVAGGSFVVVTAKLTDKWGNAVDTTLAGQDVEFEVDGLGYLSSDVVELSSKGVARTTLITSATDKGDAVITATLVGAADVDAAELKIVVGATPAATAAASGSTAKIYASATNAAGKTVVVKVNGKTVKSFAGTAAKKTVVVAATAGAKNVSVFVGGVRVLGKVVTVK